MNPRDVDEAPAWYRAVVGALPGRPRLYVQIAPRPDELEESWFADPWFAPLELEHVRALEPGQVVRVPVRGVWHEGIVTDRRDAHGRPFVIGKSKRAGVVAEEPWELFHAGQPVELVGQLGRLPAVEVLARARARLGERWTPWAHCQRFTRECHGLCEPEIVPGGFPEWFRPEGG